MGFVFPVTGPRGAVRSVHGTTRPHCKGRWPRPGVRRDRINPIVKIRALPAAGVLLLVLLVALLGWEFAWRAGHNLRKPPAAAPDQAYVAEVRALPPGRDTGVFLRGRYAYLRSLQPRLVFTGDCEEVDTRWFGPRRLVIECQLRSGEPRLLRPMVGGVVIEVVVQRQFASGTEWGSRALAARLRSHSGRIWTLRNLIAPPGMLLAPRAYCSATGPAANLASSTSAVFTPLSITVRCGPRAVIS
jgi:hypothetical protein